MTDDEGAAHAKLLAEYRALDEEYEGQDGLPEEIDARLGALELAMEKLEFRPLIFKAEEIARAGAFVTLERNGELAVYRGFVRPGDEPREEDDVDSGEQAEDEQGAELSAGSYLDDVGHGTVISSAGQALGASAPTTRMMVY
jgi:ParB family chromosome partitioning protein